jgi:autotransporter-associated beta strand protein
MLSAGLREGVPGVAMIGLAAGPWMRAAKRTARRWRVAGSSAALVATAVVSLSTSASAATFTVTTNADAGAGSLRQAVTDANASAAADTITFAAGIGQTITLSSALPDIAGDLTLDGPDADLTIRGSSNTTPLLRVASGETVLQDLTLDQGSVSIASGARLSFDLAEDRALARDISDAGALEKRGSAKLTLTGANTYTGGTNVAAGTLQGNAASVPGDVAIAAGATLIFDQAAAATKAGVLSGAGSFVKTGAGTLVLSGANTFTGQVTVSQGILEGTAASLPGSSFSVASGATLRFEQTGSGTESGAISGAGALEKNGAGTLILTGANSHTGGTRLNAGVLRGSAAALSGNITTEIGTGLVFDQPTDGTQSGSISGEGSLTKLGSGTLTLSGANSYSGGTTVSVGALRGTTSSLQGDIMNAGAVLFDQEGDGTYTGVISGAGTLEKAGGGAVRVSQSQTYAGATTISGGALELAAANLASRVDVRSAGTLGGSGSVGIVDVAGRVAPRASSGFGLLAAGNVTFASGSALDVRVDESGGKDALSSSGTVTLQSGAGLVLRPGPGSYTAPVSYDVLTGSSVVGNFTSLPQFAFLEVSVANLGDRIRATLQASGGSVTSLAGTPNQQAVARTLEALQPTASGDLASVFDSLILLGPEDVPGVLDSLSGEVISEFEHTRLSVGRRFDQVIGARLAGLRRDRESLLAVRQRARAGELPPVGLAPAAGSGPGAWLDALGLSGAIDGDDGADDLDYLAGGGALGVDYRVPGGVVGGAFGYAYTDLELSDVPGDGNAHSYLGALYAAWELSRLYLSASAHLAFHDMETEREIRFGAIDRVARGDFDGEDYGVGAAAALTLFHAGAFQLEPQAFVAYARLDRSSFSEDGAASIALDIDDESIDSLSSGLGLRAHAAFELGSDTVFEPEVFASWLHESGDVEREFSARFAGASIDVPFGIAGAEAPRDSALAGMRWVTTSAGGARAELAYSVLWNSRQLEHFASLGFHLVW